jgi:Uma2 family endonuclease
LRIAPLRIVQPDLSLFMSGMPKREGPIHVVPEFVIEVVSQNRSHDTVTKKLLYAQAGVNEYWLVDEATKTIEVLQGLKSMSSSKVRATSAVADGFVVDVKKLFKA